MGTQYRCIYLTLTIAWVEMSGWVLARYIRYGSANLFTWWEILYFGQKPIVILRLIYFLHANYIIVYTS